MNPLEKLVVSAVAIVSLVGCVERKPESAQRDQTVQLSNGMSATGDVKTSSATGAKAIHISGYGKMIVYDKGNRNVFVTYNGEQLLNLIYEYGGEQFPVWEPYAFRESRQYTEAASAIMTTGSWCPEESKKEPR